MGSDEVDNLNKKLEDERALRETAESEVLALHRKIQLVEEDFDRTEEKLKEVTEKYEESAQAADDAERQRKVLDNLNMNNEEKVEKLELALAEAQMIAEDSDKKYDESSRKLAMCESDLERSVERADDFERQCKDLEEELKIVGKNMRELEVSENRAIGNEEVYEATIREISNKLKTSEKKSVEFELLSGKLSKDVE